MTSCELLPSGYKRFVWSLTILHLFESNSLFYFLKTWKLLYNYKTGNYEPYDAAHGNIGGLKYTDGTTDSENKLIEHENFVTDSATGLPVSDTSGIFEVERINFVDNVSGIEKHYAIELLNVPMYDEEGRLNRFSLQEAGMVMPDEVPKPQCSAVYSAKIDQNPMLFTANNIFGDGGEEIHFHKVWMDDGEEEYKNDVRVDMSARAMQLPFPHSGSDTAPSGWESMTDDELQAELDKQNNNTNHDSSWLFRTLWTNNSLYQDPFSDNILGYQYLANDDSVPKSYSPGGHYESVTLPLSGNRYYNYANMSESDKAQLDALSSLLDSASAQTPKKLLNTNHFMNDDNVWTARVQVRIGYSYHPRTSDSDYGYDLRDFAEHIQSTADSQNQFILRPIDNSDTESATAWMNAIKDNSNAWITMLPARYANNHNNTANVVDLTTEKVTYPKAHINGEEVDPTQYKWLAGIYKAVYNKDGGTYDRYYAVQEIPCKTAQEGGQLSELTFQNTRIGIVNYHIYFDWNVGDRRQDMKKVSLEIYADYHDGQGPQLIKVNEKNQIDIDLINNVDDYYITNLPKYTPTGQVITYTVKEVKVNGMPFVNQKCTLDNDTLIAEIEEKDYIVNSNSNSDDLMPIVITNTFSGTTDCTVNKVWLDDTDALHTRTDLYIRLYQHSTNNNSSGDIPVGQDYLWRKHVTDSQNHWSYTYDSLPKYDPEGFRYEYYIKETVTNLKKNDYETYYENAVHMTAIDSNHHSYQSNDSVFTINDISTSGVSLTISDLDAKNQYYDGTGDNTYEFRVTDISGNPLTSSDGVTITTATTGDKATVTIDYSGSKTSDNFVFRLQRKVKGDTPKTETVNGQTVVVDDQYRDVPDYYNTGTDPATYNDQTCRMDSDGTTYGRAYDNGTITNKLVGTVTIDVKKLWQSIDPKFQAQDYPIADVFLYANIKSHATDGAYAVSNTQYSRDVLNSGLTRDFENGGYAILGGDENSSNALGELMNMIQISYTSDTTPGETTYHFSGKRTIKKENGEIQYQDNTDYVQFNDSIATFDGTGTNALDKYDENGALINYSIKERAINGYTYRISNDTIINEYNGGARVQVKVTKNWKNMTAMSKFPTVKFTLYQCYVGKNKDTGLYELKEYNTFEQTIRASDSEPVSYMFGANDKDILYQYSPTGEEFFYYVTEELIDANGQGRVSFRKKYTVDQVTKTLSLPEMTTYTYDANADSLDKMVLTDTMQLAGLGFTCTITESDEDSFKADATGFITVPRSDAVLLENGTKKISVKVENLPSGIYKAVDKSGNELTCTSTETAGKVTLTIEKELPQENPPEQVEFRILNNNILVTVDADDQPIKAMDTSLDTNIPIYKRVDVTNNYSPKEENFKSTITVDKNWELYSKSTENPLNQTEFANINNYSFTLKRKTKYIHEKSLFRVTTGTINSNDCSPSISFTEQDKDSEFSITPENPTFEMKNASGVTVTNDNEVSYYQTTLQFTKPGAYGDIVIPVTVKVDKTTKQVIIEGLAIYGQDGTRYTYIIEEIENNKNVFEPKEKRKSQQIEPIYDCSVSFTQSTASNTPLNFKLQRRIKTTVGDQTTYTDYTDVTATMIESEHIVAADSIQTHTFTANGSGQYSIPAEFAEPDGNGTKKLTVVIKGLAVDDDNHQNYEYKTDNGGYLTTYDSTNKKVNMLVTKTVSESSNDPFTFHIQRRANKTGEYTSVTSGLPAAEYSSDYVHTFSSNNNGIFTVPEVFAQGGSYSVKLNNLPQKCSKGDYEYQIVNTTDNNDSVISSTQTNHGRKVVGGMVEMGLNNQLKQFTFRLNKIFGAEYKDESGNTKYEEIPVEDYGLYFTENDFISRLRYTVERKTENTDWQTYMNLTVNQTAAPSIQSHTDNNQLYSDITAQFEKYTSGENNGKYYYDFKYMPRMNSSGDNYQYRIIEQEDSVGEYVRIYYPDSGYPSTNNNGLPKKDAAMADSTGDLSFVIQQSMDNGVSYTDVKNATLTLTGVTGASYDSVSGKITVPRENNITNENKNYFITMTGLPAKNGDTDILYRINHIQGGIDAEVSSSSENNTVTLTITVDSHSKYFQENTPSVHTAGSGGVYHTYVRNIFLGKQITLKKRWDDGNNADGLRPEILDVTLHEKIKNTLYQTQVTKQLKNEEFWARTVLLPRYYYNGDLPLNHVQFYVTEDLKEAKQYYHTGSTLEEIGYKQSDQGYIVKTAAGTKDETHDCTTRS